MTEDIASCVEKVLASAPPLTDAQRESIIALLRAGRDASVKARRRRAGLDVPEAPVVNAGREA